MQILFVCPTPPWPQIAGATLRIRSLLTSLEQLGDVDCVFFGRSDQILNTPFSANHHILDVLPRPDLADNSLLNMMMRRIPPIERGWWVSYLPVQRSLYSAQPYVHQRFERLNPRAYDIVFVVRLRTLWWLRWRDPVRTIVDIDDVHYLGAQEAVNTECNVIRKLILAWRYKNVRNAELGTLRDVAAALVCSSDDEKSMRQKKVQVIPNVFPDRGQLSRPFTIGDSKTILFVGALDYKPNREGVQYFIQNVLPLIRAQDPQVKLRIAGRTRGAQFSSWANEPGVEFLGTVEDLAPIIEDAALEVAPVLHGLGTRIKILEALSFGKPVVSTIKGAYGIDIGREAGIFRADSPSDMAAACLNLLRDAGLRQSIGEKARREVVLRHSQAKVNELMCSTVFSVLDAAG